MRLWSLHPGYLDAKGIVALWREALLAQAVIAGRTKGYRSHPQLDRFRAAPDPSDAIRRYLEEVLAEARRRGYSFDARRIDFPAGTAPREGAEEPPLIEVTSGQLDYERRLLAAKLAERSPASLSVLRRDAEPRPHPLFRRVEGGIEGWERIRELPPFPRRSR